MVNEFRLIGNVTRDPELRYTPSGTAVLDLGVAVNQKLKDGTEETFFADVTVWDKMAETIAEYVKKGKQVYVAGRMQLDQWDDKETGNKRSKIKLVAREVKFLGKKDD